MKIVITGGAGFIGSHLTDLLIEKGYDVKVIDSLEKQVHNGKKPNYLNKKAKYVFERYEKKGVFEEHIAGVDILIHLAALVGVGQSMYLIKRYVQGNSLNTASLLQQILVSKKSPKKIVVASSMSIYGEGEYICPDHGSVFPRARLDEHLRERNWEMKCPVCSKSVAPVAVKENKPLYPTSIYAISKRDQEEMIHSFGMAYGLPTVALRFFNVFGERQSLTNPYTGVLSIFASRLLNGNAPVIYEDGEQTRDFIHVKDLVRGIYLSLIKDIPGHISVNLGSGENISIKTIASKMSTLLKKNIEPEVMNVFRKGDIRHCFADTFLARKILGFSTELKFDRSIEGYMEWVNRQHSKDLFMNAQKELSSRGLV